MYVTDTWNHHTKGLKLNGVLTGYSENEQYP